MAPAILSDPPNSTLRNGLALEETSDHIDAVNVLKDQLKASSSQKKNKPSQQTHPATAAADDNDDIYSEPLFSSAKDKTQFRQYASACSRVKAFYREQHAKQTVAYNLRARASFLCGVRAEMGIWEAMERLDALIDESDPDTQLGQIEHLLQSAEAIRRDGRPRWFQLTGLIHDLGKLLFFWGAEGQWDVVGDTFPVGCAFDRRVIYHETFGDNPDSKDPVYSTENGIYTPGCGMDNVMLSWGHDEYLYHVVKDQSTLPDEALAIIRYHSFYPWHKEGAYRQFMNEHDYKMLEAVKAFNPYDLYSKSDEVPSVEELKPYYMELIDEFFPKRVIKW